MSKFIIGAAVLAAGALLCAGEAAAREGGGTNACRVPEKTRNEAARTKALEELARLSAAGSRVQEAEVSVCVALLQTILIREAGGHQTVSTAGTAFTGSFAAGTLISKAGATTNGLLSLGAAIPIIADDVTGWNRARVTKVDAAEALGRLGAAYMLLREALDEGTSGEAVGGGTGKCAETVSLSPIEGDIAKIKTSSRGVDSSVTANLNLLYRECLLLDRQESALRGGRTETEKEARRLGALYAADAMTLFSAYDNAIQRAEIKPRSVLTSTLSTPTTLLAALAGEQKTSEPYKANLDNRSFALTTLVVPEPPTIESRPAQLEFISLPEGANAEERAAANRINVFFAKAGSDQNARRDNLAEHAARLASARKAVGAIQTAARQVIAPASQP